MKHTLWSKRVQRGLPRRRVRPGLEMLEDRTVPTIFNGGLGDVATLIAHANTANGNGGRAPNMLPQSGSPLPSFVEASSLSTGGGGAGNAASPPTLFQSLLSLYLDAAVLELNNRAVEFIHGDNFNIDNFFGTPSQLATVRANAAAAGVNYDSIAPLMEGLAQFTGRNPLNSLDDLHFNFPYAGPFAWVALAAGSAAADQAVRL